MTKITAIATYPESAGVAEKSVFTTVKAAKNWLKANFDNGFSFSIWEKESDFLNDYQPDFYKPAGKKNIRKV